MDKLVLVRNFYNAEQNKKYVYGGALALWTLSISFCFSLLALLINATSKTWFYVMFLLAIPIICATTHFLLHSLLAVPLRDLGLTEPISDEPYLRTSEML